MRKTPVLICVAIVFVMAFALGISTDRMADKPFTVIYVSPSPQSENLPELEDNDNNLININSADAEELMELSGIGEVLSERIISYRTENGPFNTIEEIMNVSGIGEKTLENIRQYIVLE